jgi:hypothetical protein
MSGFSDTWLRLREPVDAASRDGSLVASLGRRLAQPIHVLDLATGTAANLRYLSPLLGRAQTWQLIDHDQALLDAIPARLFEWSRDRGASLHDTADGFRIDGPACVCEVRCQRRDLAKRLSAIDVPRGSLVTAAALLDLVSGSWLADFAEHCRASCAPVLLALTYNGEIRFEPSDPDDALVLALVNRHQSTDKGFGPALGPAAAARAVELFEHCGYYVETAQSDWRLGPQDRQLQRALLEGWIGAAIEMAPEQANVLGHWAERRNERVASGRSMLVVGHTDLVGWPLRDAPSRG